MEDFKFGQTHTDHMLEIDWSKENGWSAPKVVPYGKFRIHPAATSLHYGLSCFNGLNVLKNRDTDKA